MKKYSFIKTKSGFSMIEVIMILAIIGASAYIIGPNMVNAMDQYNLKTEAQKLRGIIIRERQNAIADQQGHGVEFSISSSYYNVGIYNGSTFTTSETLQMRHGVIVAATSVTVPNRTLYFDYFGAPQQQFAILLRNQSGDQIWINVETETGRVELI